MGNRLYTMGFIDPENLVYCLEADTGREIWRYSIEIGFGEPNPLVYGNKVFLSLHDTCYMLETDESEPQQLWVSGELCSDIATAVLIDKYLYGTHFAGRYVTTNDWNTMLRLDWPLRCVSVETGFVMWEQNMEHSTLTAADGKLILLGIKGSLRIAEVTASGYTELSRGDLSGGKKHFVFATPLVLCNGKMYCRNYYGDLICIDVSN
ncbi:MAG: PQQ-binding-like beta-propeller repeat protein [Spirochaetaceae bacterium]|nr:MAG: PQQ-binding-like beta-propeller repeat protein [Spirochaetaceae bacterium]